ncbi:putative metalloprotease CJM1_0395 family protein [Shewanella sp. MEBiC00475]|uniref:putative metalloprotease CJM1_0395 family protein n=1 Tax=Shewanella sp. MEBiC00475 TaxID=2575361 RepID=UPI0010BFB0A6|nr:putative metalloprotease CJM1_0395 family protein [Shewanella sp. MEBiC00475]
MSAAMVSSNTGLVNSAAQINHRNSLSAPQAQPHTQAKNSAQTTNSTQASKPQSAPIIAVDIQSNAVEISSLKSSTTQTSAFKTPIDLSHGLFSTDSHHGLQTNSASTNDIKPQHIVDSSSVNSYGLKSGPLNLYGVLNRTPIQLQATNTPTEASASTDIVISSAISDVENTQPPIVNQPTSPVVETKTTAQNSSVDDSTVTADAEVSNRQDDTAEQQVEQQVKDKQQQIIQAEKKQIDQLAQRDTEVKTHEQAHAAVGGSLAQSPSYQYEKGPDGRRYAVDGEVNIDVSTVDGDAQATLSKMQKVYAAAMAPIQPSMADIRVAAQALQNMNEAKKELTTNNSDSLSSTTKNNSISPNSQVLTNDVLHADDVNQNEELHSSNYLLSEHQSSEKIVNDITAAQSNQQHQSLEIYV